MIRYINLLESWHFNVIIILIKTRLRGGDKSQILVYIKLTSSLIFINFHHSITLDIFILSPYTLYACKILKLSKINNYLVCKVIAFRVMWFLKLYTKYQFIDQFCCLFWFKSYMCTLYLKVLKTLYLYPILIVEEGAV